jgi:hypothetical protein
MKVKCVANPSLVGYAHLTLGKVYEVERVDEPYVYVKDDSGEVHGFMRSNFVPDDGEITAMDNTERIEA